MSAGLERRYARLLRLYPKEYRRARGAELLATLLESAEPGRTRPPVREAGALVLGALRGHAGRDRRQSMRHSWLVAFRAAAVMLLVSDLASRALALTLDFSLPHSFWPPTGLGLNLVALALGAVAVTAALRGRYGSAVVAATAAFLVTLLLTWALRGVVFTGFWSFPLSVILLVPLLWHRCPPVAGLVKYAPVMPLLLVLTEHVLAQAFPDVSGILQRGLLLALCLGGLLWLAVDERLAMALGLLLLNSVLLQAVWTSVGGIRSVSDGILAVAVTGFLPAVLLLTSGAAARQRARV